jgi:hypothetical protein
MIFLNLTGRTSNQLLEISYAFAKKREKELIYVNTFEYSLSSKTEDDKNIDYLVKYLLNDRSKANIVEFNSKIFYMLCKSFSIFKSKIFAKFTSAHPHYCCDVDLTIFALRIICGYHQQKVSYTNLDNIVDIGRIKERNATAIHVRLGDYLSNCNFNYNLNITNSIFNALKFDESFKTRTCYIFSDGDASELCEKISNLGVKCLDFSCLRMNDIDTWFFMAGCKQIYISNSSYSATAAFVMRSRKEIFAPNKWMKIYDTPTDMLPGVKFYNV